MKWVTGSPLAFQQFSNEQNTLRYHCCPSTKWRINYFYSIYFDHCTTGSYQCQDLTKIRALSSLSVNSKSKSVNQCFLMLLSNLAEPNWVSVACDEPLLSVITCIKDNIRKNYTDAQRKSIGISEFCTNSAILVHGICYEFHWISRSYYYEYARTFFSKDILIFKHIFEVIALENTILSAFVPKNKKTMKAVKFVRYLDTVTFMKSIVTLQKSEGYIICPSNKSEIHLGSHIFNCSNGSNILYKYVCDGIVDCPNDKSDEESCLCDKAKQSKLCKSFYYNNKLILCSSTYYMVKNGHCLKYANPDKIYRKFYINHDLPNNRASITSKLTTYDTSVITFGLKERQLSVFKLKQHFRCLNQGELPCWEGYYKCYNVTRICIYQLNANNSLIPCPNGRHLKQCKTFSCDIMFKCLDNYCIPWSYVCDGKWDCPKGEDELDISVCNEKLACISMYHCRKTKHICLHLGNICDGYPDCPFGDDEFLCEMKYIECPSFCVCLLYAIDCRPSADEKVGEINPFHYLSVQFLHLKLNFMSTLIQKLKYAIILKLSGNEIRDVCDAFSKVIDFKCILLDLSFNLLKIIKNKCFSSTRFLKSLAINNNNIISVEKHSFSDLFKLRMLSLANNPVIHLHYSFLICIFDLKFLSISNVSFPDINPESFYGSKINFIYTEDYHICCIAPSGTVCIAFQPWYISCSDILPLLSMKSFYTSISILIFILNLLSILVQIRTYKSNKSFSIIVIIINVNDILCGIYLSFVWIADLSFSGSFHVNEESWRSSFLYFTAFTIVLWFTVLSQCVLIFVSFTRLVVTIFPLHTRFKETLPVVKSLVFLVLISLLFSFCIALVFRFSGVNVTSLCLPFVDPTESQLSIKILTWFTVLTQLTTSVGIMTMHFLLVFQIRRSQNKIQKSKIAYDFNVILIIQLVTITTSNILCWGPAGIIFISAMFLPTYPMDLVIWTTVIGLPINSIINPCIFISTTIRKKIKFKPKVFFARNKCYM